MARPIEQDDNVKFEYLKMSTDRNKNEFALLKKENEELKKVNGEPKYLKPFTEILPRPAQGGAPTGFGNYKPWNPE